MRGVVAVCGAGGNMKALEKTLRIKACAGCTLDKVPIFPAYR
jgi:hypothetical protein